MKRKLKELVLGAKCLVLAALCAVGLTALALPPVPYRDIWSSTPDPQAIKDPTDVIDWCMASRTFESSEAKHGKFLEASADAMIAAYTARIEKDPTDCEALICRAFAYLKKAGENQKFFDIAQEFGYTFDNDTMHFTGELIQKKGVTPEMNDVSAEVCDILLPLMKKAYADLSAVPDRWKGNMAITPDVYPVDEEIYFDWADVLCAKMGLAEMMCVLNMVKGFDVTMDSDLLEYTFNSRSPKNGKRGVQPILENNPEFFSKVRDQKAATEAGDWWASAMTLLDQWDKAHAKRSDGKQHFFDWNFEKMDDNTVQCYDWLHKHRDGLINLPYWASPFDYTLMNGDTAQFWTLQPLFAGKFLREHIPEFGVGVKEPWCNEPLLDTLPDSTLCGIYPGVSRKFLGDLMTDNKRSGDFTTIPPYNTDVSASSVHAIWYDNLFELGFDNTGNQSIFAWDTASPITLLDPTFNVRGVTAVFTGWSFSGYTNGTSKATWEGDTIPTPFPKEHLMYKRRNVVATANFTIPKVTYLDFDGTSGKMAERTDECELVTVNTTTFEAGKVYTVLGNVTIEKRITVSGTPANPTKLVLCDGAALMAMNGIDVSAGNALVICGQALGTGTLEATGSSGAAGIGGGGDVTINGGTVMAAGGSSAAGIGGTVTINSISPERSESPIGDGYQGCTVTATGSDGAAGIGGTVKFADGTAYGVAAGADEANALYKTAAAYAADPSAAYVALPYFSLKIPEAKAGYSYEVSYVGVRSKAALADQTNEYAIAAGATARVLFTPGEDYLWEKAPEENPMIIANLSGDTVVDAADLPTTKFVKKGSAGNPWAVGYSTRDSVAAYTNGVGGLVVEGEGNMKDFAAGAPWGTGISEVEIGEDVTGIGARAFADSQLGSVTIPASVTSIGASAFFGSTSLSNVTVEAMTPPALGEGAFVELAEGYQIIVPQGTGAAYKAAPDWSLYADSIVEQGSPECPWEIGKTAGDSVIAYLDDEGKLVVEGTGNMKDFDPSSDPAPWGTDIAEVEIGEGVTGIGAKAFAGCASLSSVVVEAMTPPALGEGAFADTAEDLKICVPAGTAAAYKAAPGWRTYKGSIVEPGSPDCPWEIGKTADDTVCAYTNGIGGLVIEGEGDMRDFAPPSDPAPWGTGISEVEIGEDVTGIGARAFADSQLGSVTIPASVTSIGASAFFGSTSLSNVTVEAMTPPALGEGAFVELAEGYQIIVPQGTGAAYKAAPDWSLYADSIVEQGSPECPWEIGKTAGDSVIAYLDDEGKLVVEGTGNMKDFDPPSDPAPWGTGIAEVEIGEGVTGIGAKAFADSQLGSVTIPASVTSIGAAAFFGSTSLSNVVVEAMTPPALGADAFAGTAEDLTICVPYGTGAAYKAAPGWSAYAGKIVEQGPEAGPWKVGTGVTTYIDAHGALHIVGTGEMKDFTAKDPAPWAQYASQVKSIEIGTGVTKVGNAAFAALDYAATTETFVVLDGAHGLNTLAFVSADGSVTNAPAIEAFRVFNPESGAEPIEAFYSEATETFYDSVSGALSAGEDALRLVTLEDVKDIFRERLTEAAGEKPYSKAMQELLGQAFKELDAAKTLADAAGVADKYAAPIQKQATLDKVKGAVESEIAEAAGPQPWTKNVEAAITGAVRKIDEATTEDAVRNAGADGIAAVREAKAADEKDSDLGGTIPGSDLKWAFVGNQLTISGSGAMPDVLTEVPWSKNVTNITTVVVGDEVTGISKGLFTAGLTAPVETVLFESAETWVPLEAFVSADGTKTNGAAAILFNADGKYAAPYAWIGEDDDLYASYAEALAAGEQAVRPSFATSGGAEEQIEKAAAAIVERVQSYDEKTGRFTTDPEGSPIAVVATVENVNTNEVETSGRIAVSGVDGLAEAARLEAAGSVGVTVVSLTVDAVQTNSMDDVQQGLVGVMTNDLDSAEGFAAKFAEITLATNDVPVAEAKAVIEIHIPYGTSGRENFSVVRIHGGQVDKFVQIDEPAEKPADGTFMVRNGELVVWTMRFSLYAIGSTDSGMLDPSALGEVKYPRANASTGLLREKSTARWTAKPYDACVFAGWVWTNGTPAAAFGLLSENELKNKTLKLKIAAGEQVRPTDVGAVWARIDEDLLGEVMLTPAALLTESKSYVTASVSGLPSGLKFNKKTLAIEWSGKKAPKDAVGKKVKVTVKNASGYTFKQTFLVTVSGGEIARVVPVDDQVRTGVPLMLWGDDGLGKVKGSKVYVAGKKASIRATPAKGSIFLGWYEDPEFANAATNLPKGYLTASQSVVVPEEGLHLFARFVGLQPWTVGNFDGICYDADTNALGTVTLTVSSKGKVSGKAKVGGKTYAFSAPQLDDAFEEEGATFFVAHPTVKVDGEKKTFEVVIGESWISGLGFVELSFGEETDSPFAVAVQNGWKLKPSALPAFPTGKAALTCEAPMGIGLTLKFGAKGKVTLSGTVPGDDLSPVKASGSTYVLPLMWTDEGYTNLFSQTCVYVPPKKNLATGFCEVYDLMLEAEESGTMIEAVKILSPEDYSNYTMTGKVPRLPPRHTPK